MLSIVIRKTNNKKNNNSKQKLIKVYFIHYTIHTIGLVLFFFLKLIIFIKYE